MKQTIKINGSQLRQVISETVKKVLKEDKPMYSHGGNIGGEHQKPISDKDYDAHYDRTGKQLPDMPYKQSNLPTDAYDIQKEKWLDRFENYFGTRNIELVWKFLDVFKSSVEYYDDNYRQNSIDSINSLINGYRKDFGVIYNTLGINDAEDILKNFKTYEYEYNDLYPNKSNNFKQRYKESKESKLSQTIRINESKLRQEITQVIRRVLKEAAFNETLN